MALNFLHRASLQPARIAIFPGAWNPPTVAHVAIAQASLQWADEVIWILPKSFPHKSFDGASFEQRQEMLRQLARTCDAFSAAVSETNLHIEMAREASVSCGPEVEIGVICGRDAVERIATWDYGRPGVFEEMLAAHPLLVASRQGEYTAASHLASRVIPLQLEADFNDVSSSEVRRRVEMKEAWQHLVPETLVPEVARLYSAGVSAEPEQRHKPLISSGNV
ncbi:MAG: hypothetical protein EBY17_00180 [Acidobacteriia bacterium]|nr:hypothetical protein [Terriglobia bacterium]